MKRILLHATTLSLAILVLSGTILHSPSSFAAGMNDYCQIPPYVVQNIAPNVMLMMDSSGSMFNFSYYDGFNTPANLGDDDLCTNSSSPCTGFTDPGTYPAYKYYGYFDSDYWYTYSSNRFVRSAPKTGSGLDGARDKQSTEWDGNFLNWLTMRRVDILRKVMTGGRTTTGEGSGFDRLIGEKADCDNRGKFKQIGNAQNYTPSYSGTRKFHILSAGGTSSSGTCNGSGSGTSSFQVRNDPTGGDGSGSEGTFNVAVRVPVPVEGVLQSREVGARARLGLTFYNTNDGGYVQVPVAGGSLSSTVNQINLTRPNANTPLGETLWTITGYFAQQASISGYNAPSGTGPRYNSGDYQNNSNNDPLNYGTGGTTRWPVCSKSFVLLITDGEPCSDGDLPSNLVNYASGRSAFDCSGGGCPAVDNTTPLAGPGTFSFTAAAFPSCPAGNYTAGLEDAALFAHTNDLRNSPTMGSNNIANAQTLTLYAVFAFGKGSTLLRYAAINGGFEDNGSHVPFPQETWDKNGDNEPDTYYEATDGQELEQSIRDAFSSILKRASSGTAASVLASGEGSGANLIQAVFYPRRAIGNDIIWWTGSLQNMWYFVDPFFANATIREDTIQDNVLNLDNDHIAQFFFDPVSQLTQVKRFNSDNNGVLGSEVTPPLSFEAIHSLWEAGRKLWERTGSRTLYTGNIGGTLDPSSTMTVFSTANASTLDDYLLETGDNVTTTIDYVHGIDNTDDLTMRSRTVTFGTDNNVWKLGDVVNSTPRIVASVPLNKYDSVYNDTTYTAFISDNNYKNRGMVFTGGNDGMLHAFRLGRLELSWTGRALVEKARITDPFSSTLLTTLGDEQWGFIPKNALPYLKYLKDPDYCHLYYADLAPYVFDASIGGASTAPRTASSWRTVLIGGMRTGGACGDDTSTPACTTANNCVKTPGGGATGFSSYFALDVTDPANPSLMWEFPNSTYPNPGLGFTTTGPAVVRINGLNASNDRDRSLNGEWYVVFGSGPTGPIDNTNNQFLGRSNQNLKFFVLNLATGALVQTIDTTIPNAFAGSMINSVADFNLDYQDDAIYVGYVKKPGLGSTWTDGGVGRILTANTTPDVVNWAWSPVIDGIGPVTSSVARLQNNNFGTNWLFFGTGRYYFENPATGTETTPEIDDPTGQRRLFGVKDPCFFGGTINPATCVSTSSSSSVAFGSLTNVSSIGSVPVEGVANLAGFPGWFINLEGSGNYSYDNTAARLYRSERVITDPLATTSGVVFFTTYKPYGDECALGGKSFLWALRYNTGGKPSDAVMKGKALVQVSTASVEQIDLSTAFKAEYGGGMDGRRTAAIEGVPPTAQGLSLLSQPPPVKRIMHMMER